MKKKEKNLNLLRITNSSLNIYIEHLFFENNTHICKLTLHS